MKKVAPEETVRLKALEAVLLDPNVRRDAARLEALLDDDFTEIGRSGRRHDRAQIIALLAGSPDRPVPAITNFTARQVAENLVLAVYDLPGSRRSSLWRRHDLGWRLVFHQGTPLADAR